MTDPTDTDDKDDRILLGEILRPLIPRSSHIKKGTVLATIIAGLLGAVYFVAQPTRRSASLDFRPLFKGAQQRQYPNGLPFSGTDIVDQSIVGQVFTANNIGQYCTLDAFQSGFVVQETSPEMQFLEMDYQARLSAPELTSVDRERLQTEYASRRASIPWYYRLAFVQPPDCSSLPPVVVFKVMPELLETWARDADQKRGVTRFRVSVLSPQVFDHPGDEADNVIIRADLLRTAIVRVLANISAVEGLPGAELVRGSERNVSFAEVRVELEDLLRARLQPLIALAGRGLGAEPLRFLEQALLSAEIQWNAAQQRAEAYRAALREYTGTAAPAAASALSERDPNSRDLQAPQIDRTFIDRIVDLSEANTMFRQEITRQVIGAAIEVTERGAIVQQYRQLLASIRQSGSGGEPATAIATLIERISTQAKDATKRFNDIYDEFTAISLRPGPQMYRVERPVASAAVRSFTIRSYALGLLTVLFVTPILLSVVYLVHYHLAAFIRGIR
jgi:hypothetical protein